MQWSYDSNHTRAIQEKLTSLGRSRNSSLTANLITFGCTQGSSYTHKFIMVDVILFLVMYTHTFRVNLTGN